MMIFSRAPGNYLLTSMPPAEVERWTPLLEWIELPLGKVLYESGSSLSYVYFPITAIVSLLYVTKEGDSSQLAIVGSEGIVGIAAFLGGGSTSSRAVVQSAGCAFRMKAQLLKEEFNRPGPFMHVLLSYTQALMTQMAQTAVCNRHHSLEKQLCRWLLLSLDRLHNSEIVMTQELIASMLGVRRESVTEAACKLQKLGLISYTRGHISVLDRLGLEKRTCECYAVVRNEYNRLLPVAPATPHVAPVSRVAGLSGLGPMQGGCFHQYAGFKPGTVCEACRRLPSTRQNRGGVIGVMVDPKIANPLAGIPAATVTVNGHQQAPQMVNDPARRPDQFSTA